MSQYINGRCYDTDLKSKNLIRFEIDETMSVKKLIKLKQYQKVMLKNNSNLSRFIILIVSLHFFNNRTSYSRQLSKKD